MWLALPFGTKLSSPTPFGHIVSLEPTFVPDTQSKPACLQDSSTGHPQGSCRSLHREPSPSGLAQVFPCSSRIPSSYPFSSEKAPPILRGDHHLPRPTTCASANAAKGIESNQLFSACQEHRCSPQLPWRCGPSRDFPPGAAGMSFPS